MNHQSPSLDWLREIHDAATHASTIVDAIGQERGFVMQALQKYRKRRRKFPAGCSGVRAQCANP